MRSIVSVWADENQICCAVNERNRSEYAGPCHLLPATRTTTFFFLILDCAGFVIQLWYPVFVPILTVTV
jgi:hypothetical protein